MGLIIAIFAFNMITTIVLMSEFVNGLQGDGLLLSDVEKNMTMLAVGPCSSSQVRGEAGVARLPDDLFNSIIYSIIYFAAATEHWPLCSSCMQC